MHRKIDSDHGFADSEFVSYQRKHAEFTVIIAAWNNKLIEIVFSDVEGILDYGLGDISDFVEETEKDAFFEKILSLVYVSVPDDSPYRLYKFLDLDGQTALEVVASTVNVITRS